MEEKTYEQLQKENEIGYQYSGAIQRVILNNEENHIWTQPINSGEWASFYGSHIELKDTHVHAQGEVLKVTRDGKEYKCFNPDGLYDWPIAMLIYLKKKNLLEDFKNFYGF